MNTPAGGCAETDDVDEIARPGLCVAILQFPAQAKLVISLGPALAVTTTGGNVAPRVVAPRHQFSGTQPSPKSSS